MAGAYYPGRPWSELDGDYTLAANRQSITLAAAPTSVIRTPWKDTGATLARVNWAGTAAGTVLGRSSDALPDSRDDGCLILPHSGDLKYSYDGGLIADPEGGSGITDWVFEAASGTRTVNADSVTIDSVGGTHTRFRPSSGTTVSIDDLITMHCRFMINSGSGTNAQGVWWKTTAGSGLNLFEPNFYANGRVVEGTSGLEILPAGTLSQSVVYDFWVQQRASASVHTQSRAWYRAAGSNTIHTINSPTFGNTMSGVNSGLAFVYWGNCFSSSTCNFTWYAVRLWSGKEWAAVTDGQTSFTPNRRYWQFKGGTLANGTLTQLDFSSSLSAPTAPTTVTPKGLTNTEAAEYHGSVGGALAYRVRVENQSGPTTVATYDTQDTGSVYAGLSAGTYKFGVKTMSADGIESAAETLSDPFDMPPDAGAQPPSNVLIASLEAPTNVRIAFDGVSTLKIFLPAEGTGALSNVTLERSATWDGSYTTDATQSTNPKTYASLTFNGSTPGVSYATNHGWTLSASYWYRVKWTDANSSIAYSGPISGATQAASEITVSGAGLSEYAGLRVSCKLTSPVSLGGRTYPKTQPYTSVVAADGTWSITNLPRLAKAGCTALDGATTVYAAFELPGGTRGKAVLPDSGSVSFENLTFA